MGHETPPHWDRSMRDRLRRGEAAALAELYDRFVSLAYAIAHRALDDEEDVGRVTREVFTHLWESPDDFDPDQGPMRSWIAAEAHRRALDELRRALPGPDLADTTRLAGADGAPGAPPPGPSGRPTTAADGRRSVAAHHPEATPPAATIPTPDPQRHGSPQAGETDRSATAAAPGPGPANGVPASPVASTAVGAAAGHAGDDAGRASALHAASTAARADYIVTAMPEPLRDALEITRFEYQDYRRTARALGITESEACRRLRLGLQLLATAAEYPMGTTRESS
jgi:RNA polymerase sigma factor (sigma-70 family)